MIHSIDPIYDYMRYSDNYYNKIKNKPNCCECGEHIQEEYGYHIGSNWYCPRCMEEFIEYIDE